MTRFIIAVMTKVHNYQAGRDGFQGDIRIIQVFLTVSNLWGVFVLVFVPYERFLMVRTI